MSNFTRNLFVALLVAKAALAGTITFSGLITQATGDGTGPAVQNPSLNNILDGDLYLVTLNFQGQIGGPGLYNTPDLTLSFVDAAAGASETMFSSASLFIAADGPFYDLSLQGCLSSGSGCNVGNELAANFQVLATNFQSPNAPAGPIAGLNPALDLLEDDGVTDIQGTVASFSNTIAPEPDSIGLFAIGSIVLFFLKSRKPACVKGLRR